MSARQLRPPLRSRPRRHWYYSCCYTRACCRGRTSATCCRLLHAPAASCCIAAWLLAAVMLPAPDARAGGTCCCMLHSTRRHADQHQGPQHAGSTHRTPPQHAHAVLPANNTTRPHFALSRRVCPARRPCRGTTTRPTPSCWQSAERPLSALSPMQLLAMFTRAGYLTYYSLPEFHAVHAWLCMAGAWQSELSDFVVRGPARRCRLAELVAPLVAQSGESPRWSRHCPCC